ncbi:hypothetical protein [Nitratireductor sp. XY-223]|uniref:hypothetical protein n=1 Tax=Nitratireductor sp. XY-223 TaxID=2561926 RepID=UPI0010A9F782|nr:hypothetical protein [Nitratireductor sp. XY-223]
MKDVIPQPELHVGGSGDLLVDAEIDGTRAGLLIEDKIDASAAVRQADRYAEHAKYMRCNKGYTRVVTVLVAPARYVGESGKYEFKVNLEEVAEMIDSPSPGRRDYRRNIIERALETAKREPEPDPKMLELHKAYRKCMEEMSRDGEQEFVFPPLKPTYFPESCYVEPISHPKFPNHVFLRHKLWTKTDPKHPQATGMVDLVVDPVLEMERRALLEARPEGSTFEGYPEKDKKGARGIQFGLKVSELRHDSFCETKVAEALKAMQKWTECWLKLDSEQPTKPKKKSR